MKYRILVFLCCLAIGVTLARCPHTSAPTVQCVAPYCTTVTTVTLATPTIKDWGDHLTSYNEVWGTCVHYRGMGIKLPNHFFMGGIPITEEPGGQRISTNLYVYRGKYWLSPEAYSPEEASNWPRAAIEQPANHTYGKVDQREMSELKDVSNAE